MPFPPPKKPFFLAALALFLAASIPPVAQAAAPGNREALAAYNLTDDEIDARCASAIETEIDMVEEEDEIVPRCVHIYREQRATYEAYVAAEEEAKASVGKATVDCDASQKSCLEAGRELAAKGEAAFQNLGDSAAKAAERLSPTKDAATKTAEE